MKNIKIILGVLMVFVIPFFSFANYKLENGSQKLVNKYNFSTKNLKQNITRKEFVETLFVWYKDYKSSKGVNVNYQKYPKLDNSKIFTDIDLKSEFGKKVSFFVGVGAFSKVKYFNPQGILNQKDFFTVMKRLKIIYSIKNCKYHKICEKEADGNTKFVKGTYYKYVSKILDKKLRNYGKSAKYYIDNGYKPFLSPKYKFPIKGQTLNGCYAFSIRNILKYKYGIGIYISKAEKVIKKPSSSLWSLGMMNDFDKITHVKKRNLYHIDTLINYLQAGEPLSVTYWLPYYSKKHKKNMKVLHIVAAYSFDENGVWVAETVSMKRKLIPWNEIFNKWGFVGYRRMSKYYYEPKQYRTQEEKDFERKNNILAGEF